MEFDTKNLDPYTITVTCITQTLKNGTIGSDAKGFYFNSRAGRESYDGRTKTDLNNINFAFLSPIESVSDGSGGYKLTSNTTVKDKFDEWIQDKLYRANSNLWGDVYRDYVLEPYGLFS